MLDGTEDFEVVGDAAKAAEAVVLMASKSPDLILIDAETHDMKDLETIRLLMDRGYTGSIVTIGCEIDQLEEAIQLGVMGYVTKDESASEILAVMRGVAQGDFAFGPSVMRTTQGMELALGYIRYITGEKGGARETGSERIAGPGDESGEPAQRVPAGDVTGPLLTEPGAESTNVGRATPLSAGSEGPEHTAELSKHPTESTKVGSVKAKIPVSGDVELVIGPLVETPQILELYQWLREVAYAEFYSVDWSTTRDSTMKATIRRPVPLLQMLGQLPQVVDVTVEPPADGDLSYIRVRLVLRS